MQKAVRSDDSTLRSDVVSSHADLCPHTTKAPSSVSQYWSEVPILSAMPKSRHTSVLTGESMARATSLPVHCSNVDMSQGSTWGNHPEGEFSKTSGQYFSQVIPTNTFLLRGK